jgi:hypothetical protein
LALTLGSTRLRQLGHGLNGADGEVCQDKRRESWEAGSQRDDAVISQAQRQRPPVEWLEGKHDVQEVELGLGAALVVEAPSSISHGE